MTTVNKCPDGGIREREDASDAPGSSQRKITKEKKNVNTDQKDRRGNYDR